LLLAGGVPPVGVGRIKPPQQFVSWGPAKYSVPPERRGWPRVPFVGVIGAYVLRALRDLKLPMDRIRKAAELVRDGFDDPYALAHRRIVTDGVALFVRMADASYVRALDRQLAFADVLEDHLKEIDWDATATPSASICAPSRRPPT
jgi:hypothetical protein